MLDDIGVVIVAGGSGTRFGERNKLLALLGGLPVFLRSIRSFRTVCPDDHIVLVVGASHLQAFTRELNRHLPGNTIRVAIGGATRTESVMNGLETLPNSTAVAAVHDAARPFATADLLMRCVESCRRKGSGVAGRPATDTVKKADAAGKVLETLDRSAVWLIETPQVFPFMKLKEAYQKAVERQFAPTDDAGVMESFGHSVHLVEAQAPNLKITYPHDLTIAETLIAGVRTHTDLIGN